MCKLKLKIHPYAIKKNYRNCCLCYTVDIFNFRWVKQCFILIMRVHKSHLRVISPSSCLHTEYGGHYYCSDAGTSCAQNQNSSHTALQILMVKQLQYCRCSCRTMKKKERQLECRPIIKLKNHAGVYFCNEW